MGHNKVYAYSLCIFHVNFTYLLIWVFFLPMYFNPKKSTTYY
jgi:hypothetical protein